MRGHRPRARSASSGSRDCFKTSCRPCLNSLSSSRRAATGSKRPPPDLPPSRRPTAISWIATPPCCKIAIELAERAAALDDAQLDLDDCRSASEALQRLIELVSSESASRAAWKSNASARRTCRSSSGVRRKPGGAARGYGVLRRARDARGDAGRTGACRRRRGRWRVGRGRLAARRNLTPWRRVSTPLSFGGGRA